MTIELEGSALAHSYYLLAKSGVVIRSVDYEAPPLEFGMQTFGKLVRDAVPSVIESRDELAKVSRLTPSSKLAALKLKLLEESFELRSAANDFEILEEAADVFEVLLAILDISMFSRDDLVRRADEKREERGGFSEGVFLEATYLRQLFSGSEDSARLFPVEEVSASGPSMIDHSAEKIGIIGDIKDGRFRIDICAVPPFGSESTRHQSVSLKKFGLDSEIEINRVGDRILIDLRREENDNVSDAQLSLFDLDTKISLAPVEGPRFLSH
jgi:predicted house-cleaning noncanonical NTP pyrophosphatase (MazG superfamily)